MLPALRVQQPAPMRQRVYAGIAVFGIGLAAFSVWIVHDAYSGFLGYFR